MSEYKESKSAFIQEIANNATISGGLQTLLSTIAEHGDDVKKAYECVNEFFNSPLHSEDDVKIKKLYAAALSMAAAKGFIPKMPAETIAIIADFGSTNNKAQYQYAAGKIDMETLAETIADKATTIIVTVARKFITPATIEKGLNVCINIISKIFPTANILKMYTPQISKWAATTVQVAITKVAPVVKTVIKNTIVTVTKTASRLITSVMAGLKRLFA